MTALTSRDDGWDTRARSPTVTYTYAAYVEKLPVSMHGLGRAQHVAYKCHCCSQQPTWLPAATHHWIEPTPRDAKTAVPWCLSKNEHCSAGPPPLTTSTGSGGGGTWS